ncbi:MAG TPA: pyridoxamine 5'-phosphate oxidase family protein [Gemmatimonadaceae bacterium]|jgi:nitroimidazol reductase NimA-like FMN-containing flavoprotein (pyridoxamine 5'-phosphate oxidase superfamily)|nr:pyridoxamine 5'-phosphate oxidase family protein [Gemmatimonadaceae bacterium]
MTRTREPTFRDLAADEAAELLARNHIGRIAFSFHDRVDIEPLSYVFADGAIYLRTAPGSKLETLAHSPWVAFEVDEVKDQFDWWSVVVHGTVYVLQDTGGEIARETYRVALDRIRQLVPAALTHRDPTPTRQVILKLHITEIRGRSASSRDG